MVQKYFLKILMRILHTESSTDWGGQELRIINEMEQMQCRGHHVILACRELSPIWNAAHQKQLNLVNVPFIESTFQWNTIKKIKHLISLEQIEIVNTHSSVDSWVASLAAKRTDAVCIRSRHICSPLKNDVLHRIRHQYLTDAFITTGEALRQDLIEQNGIAPARVTSIPSGVEEKYFCSASYDKQMVRRSLNITPDAFVWCMTAFMRKMKGHAVLLDAIALLQRDFPDVHFIFVGGVDSQISVTEDILEQSTTLGIRDKCHFLGTRNDVPEILAGCNAFVLPSLFTEGLPQGLTQAMAMGLPVVSTDVGAITEVLKHNETGYLVKAGNSENLAHVMMMVMTHYTEAKQKADAAQQLISQHYSLDVMVNMVEQFYNRLLQKS